MSVTPPSPAPVGFVAKVKAFFSAHPYIAYGAVVVVVGLLVVSAFYGHAPAPIGRAH